MKSDTSTARRQRAGTALALAGVVTGAAAAGGHFEVDDAALLPPQRCQVELWALRGEVLRLAHFGPACRVGPVEVGLAFDRLSEDAQHDAIAGIQVKWATALAPQLEVGLVASASRDTTRGVNLWTVYAPLTWSATDSLQLHANLGGDSLGQRGTTKRLGIGGDWAPDRRFTLLAERLWALDVAVTRVGLRVAVGESATIDASGARLSGSGNRIWGLGLAFEFGR